MMVARLSMVTTALAIGLAAVAVAAAEEGEGMTEYRGAWIATVNNIDWPSEAGLSTEAQKAEMIALLDTAKALNLNVVLFQVRPACDAFYRSDLEPWSEYLTGEMGKAPDPYYDPLEFACAEAHKRGLQIEAWFNPYRARHPRQRSEASKDHVSLARPELVKQYGEYQWLEPGDPKVQDYTTAVLLDVVRRYDIDGVHFDDYFYPYPVKGEDGEDAPFPDEENYKAYRDGGGKLDRDDWRRDSVNTLVARLHREIHALKPDVRFGISPFGIWRPGHPEQIQGFDQYAKLYADPIHWMKAGTVDYIAPQLYWPSYQEAQSYPVLLKWWVEQGKGKIPVIPGNFTTRATGGEKAWGSEEYLGQIRSTRELGAAGNIHFHLLDFQKNAEFTDTIREEVYSAPATVPTMR